MKYHKAHLTRRLILDLSNDQEMEEQTVIMLKVIKYLVQKCFLSLKSLIFVENPQGHRHAARVHQQAQPNVQGH